MSRENQAGPVDVGVYLDMQRARAENELKLFTAKAGANKLFLDYVARSAVGTGKAGAYVAEFFPSGAGFLLRGGYKLVEGAGKLAVGLAPSIASILIAKYSKKKEQPEFNPYYGYGYPPGMPPVPPEAGGPMPQGGPYGPGPFGPGMPGQGYGYGYPQGMGGGMNRTNSPSNSVDPTITVSPTNTANPANTNNVNPTISPVNTNTVSPIFNPVFNNNYSPVVNVYLDSQRVTSAAKEEVGTKKVKGASKTKIGKNSTVKRASGKVKRTTESYTLKGEGHTIKLTRREYLLFKKHHDKDAGGLEKRL